MRSSCPLDQVRVIYPAIGGAFGGREDMSVQIVLALAVMRLAERGIRRPVKIIWSREESIVGHHKRHQFFIHAKWGAKKDGRLLAAECELVSDAGAYAYTSPKVLGNATLMCTGPYVFPNAKVDAYTVYTNNVPGGAFRGFGGPQGAYAAELQLEKLAERLGLDPVDMRMQNLLTDGALSTVGTPFPAGVTIDQVVARCAAEAGWERGKGLPPASARPRPICAAGAAWPAPSRTSVSHLARPSPATPPWSCTAPPRLSAWWSITPAPIAARARTPSWPKWRPRRPACR